MITLITRLADNGIVGGAGGARRLCHATPRRLAKRAPWLTGMRVQGLGLGSGLGVLEVSLHNLRSWKSSPPDVSSQQKGDADTIQRKGDADTVQRKGDADTIQRKGDADTIQEPEVSKFHCITALWRNFR